MNCSVPWSHCLCLVENSCWLESELEQQAQVQLLVDKNISNFLFLCFFLGVDKCLQPYSHQTQTEGGTAEGGAEASRTQWTSGGAG